MSNMWFLKLMFIFFGMAATAKEAYEKIGYFWHVTDLHYDGHHNSHSDYKKGCWKPEYDGNGGSYTQRKPMGRYGDYRCDAPWELIESAARTMMSRQNDNVEFVLWTGDALSNSVGRLTQSHQLLLLQNLTDLLGKTFSSQFVFPALGHDDPVSRKELGKMWSRWLPTDSMNTFETVADVLDKILCSANSGTPANSKIPSVVDSKAPIPSVNNETGKTQSMIFQSILLKVAATADFEGKSNLAIFLTTYYQLYSGYYMIERKMFTLQIVVLNTNLMRRDENDEDARKQWEWLNAVLHKFKHNKETVYLVGHMPPGSDERQKAYPPAHATYTDHHNKKFLSLVRKYSDIIVGQFFGHLHSDTFRIIYNDSGRPVSWAMISPAVTPKRTTDGPNNPGLRLYKFDKDTGQVFDYTQYYLDLSNANSNSKVEAEWSVEYTFSSYYGISYITPLSLHNLAEKLTLNNHHEQSMFHKYYKANSVRMYSSPQGGVCDANCAHTHYCAITRVDYKEFEQCLKTAASALASSTPETSFTFCSHLFFLSTVTLNIIAIYNM